MEINYGVLVMQAVMKKKMMMLMIWNRMKKKQLKLVKLQIKFYKENQSKKKWK
jgi:hypothetical protein